MKLLLLTVAIPFWIGIAALGISMFAAYFSLRSVFRTTKRIQKAKSGESESVAHSNKRDGSAPVMGRVG